ncbi:MAG: alpha-amylase/4-alpha-glucanotransferase domain-containing protein, partial [Thermoleophilia bacterium]
AEDWGARRRPPNSPPPLAVYDDDGEKFGGWPGTHDHVYGSGWLHRFLTALEEEADAGWLALTTLGAFRREFPPLGRVYLPTGSYAEMLEWSGGYYRNFLVRYEEANLLHKRMLHTSRAVSRCAQTLDAGGTSGREMRKAVLLARDRVLRAQCNDAYWHGIFGGLYLPHLRHAVYASLIEAEALVGRPMRPAVEVLDLDLDGHDEVFLRSPHLTALVRPARGGSVVGLDHLPSSFALLDTLRRRREPEHAALEELAAATSASTSHTEGGGAGPEGAAESRAPQTIHEGVRMKEPGLERLLFVDRHPRTAFLDHFYHPSTGLQALVESTADDLGDFADARYLLEETESEGPHVRLTRTGVVAGRKVSIEKVLALGGGPASLEATYVVRVHTEAPSDTEVLFAPEVNLTLLAGWAPDRYVLVDGVRPPESHLAGAGAHPGAASVALVDESVGLRVSCSWDASLSGCGGDGVAEATLYRYGVVTVSLSEDGYERIYQATSLVPCWRLPLDAGTELRMRFRLEVDG